MMVGVGGQVTRVNATYLEARGHMQRGGMARRSLWDTWLAGKTWPTWQFAEAYLRDEFPDPAYTEWEPDSEATDWILE